MQLVSQAFPANALVYIRTHPHRELQSLRDESSNRNLLFNPNGAPYPRCFRRAVGIRNIASVAGDRGQLWADLAVILPDTLHLRTVSDQHITAVATIVQDVLLLLSAGLIGWYLWETRKMRIAAE